MTIQWRNDLQIDCGNIDNDHKALIKIINQFENEKTLIGTHALLIELSEYSKRHFYDEEKILLDMGYPEYHEHLVEHNWLTYSLTIIVSSFNSPSKNFDVSLIHSRAAKLLRHWLVDHIIAWDIPFRNFLIDRNKTFRANPLYLVSDFKAHRPCFSR